MLFSKGASIPKSLRIHRNLKKFAAAQEMLRLSAMGNCPARAWQLLCLQLGLGNTQARRMSFLSGWLTGTSKAKRPKPHSFPPQQAQSLSCIPILMTGTFMHQDAQKGNLTAISNVSISLATNPTSSPRLWVIRSCIFFLLNCCNLSTWMTFSPDNCNSLLCTVLPAVTFYPPKLSLSITSSRQASWTQQSDFGALYRYICQGPHLLYCECWLPMSPPPPPEFLWYRHGGFLVPTSMRIFLHWRKEVFLVLRFFFL